MQRIFDFADILLPAFMDDPERAKKWAVIACDQYTSEPEYWSEVEKTVGEAPSTLRLILPEVYLTGHDESRLTEISAHMAEYGKDLLTYPNALIYVRRMQTNGKIRTGIVGKIDLEAYDYAKDSCSPVRATEGTVLERIPPRVAIRRAATMELPHIMILIDDVQKTVIEPLDGIRESFRKLYDFDLMQNGGHIEGYLLPGSAANSVFASLDALFASSSSGIRFAVGDGNHSLASAKARYEALKTEIGEESAKKHPLRYALCEVVNLHEESLEFEPIYRLVRTPDPESLLHALAAYGADAAPGTQTVTCLCGGESRTVSLGAGTHTLTVGTLQNFLDAYRAEHPETEIDYIHGMDSIRKLAAEKNSVGFLFDGMRKEELFAAVEKDGALPRKTFSMGEANDKRFYIECRKITQ